jgi:hypothetical protein
VLTLLYGIAQLRYLGGVTSSDEVAKLKAEIEMLEKARESCTDSGIREQIDIWLEAHKKTLKQLTGRNPKYPPPE